VQGNYIGTDASGLLNAGNTNSGIIIQGTSVNNTIGGTGTGEANIIANNNGSGVLLASTVVDNTIRGNSIYGNTGLAIDLNGDGSANSNDTGDTDSGANNLQNAPVLTSATLPTTTGADGLLVEVHHDPEHSLTGDSKQSLLPGQFAGLMNELKRLAWALDRETSW